MRKTLFDSLLSLYEKRKQDGRHTPLEDFCTESLVGLLRLYNLEKNFIQEVLRCNISCEKIKIDTQYARNDCRVDIVIRAECEAIYFIEMKVNAHEGYNQLERYDKLLKEESFYEQKILFYCTKYPDKKSYDLENEFHQFRWNDIYMFLKKYESKEAIKDFLCFLEKENVAFEEKLFTKECIDMEKLDFNQLNNCIILCLDMLGINERGCCDWIDKEVGGYKKFGKKGNEYKNIPIELGFNIGGQILFAYYWLDIREYSRYTKIGAYHSIKIDQDISQNELAQEWAKEIKNKVAQIQNEIARQFKNWTEQLKFYGNVCSHTWKTENELLNKCPYVGFDYICNNHKVRAIIEFTAFVWGGKYHYGIHYTKGENDELIKAEIDKLGLKGEMTDCWYILKSTTPNSALNNLLDLCKKMDGSESFKRI